MVSLTGTIDKIIFHNDKNGYTVAKFNILEGSNDETSTTVTGKFISPKEGTFLKINGDWVEHMVYGEQFNIESYSHDLPSSNYGIEKYLSSGILPGIGKKMATTLIKEFGSDFFDILENHPKELLKINGIGPNKLKQIVEAYKSQKNDKDLLVQLQEYDISPAIAQRLIDKYGSNTVNVLLENPYKIALEVQGIGFLRADEIATKLGYEKKDDRRILSGIVYALQECYRSGHTYLTEAELLSLTSKLLEVDKELIEKELSEAVIQGSVYQDYIDEDAVYYPLELYKAESDAAYAISQLAQGDIETKDIDIDQLIKRVEKKLAFKLDKSQREAIKAVIDNPIVIISGGPGTGKSATSSAFK